MRKNLIFFWRVRRPEHDKQLYSLLFLEPLNEIIVEREKLDVDIKVSCRQQFIRLMWCKFKVDNFCDCFIFHEMSSVYGQRIMAFLKKLFIALHFL